MTTLTDRQAVELLIPTGLVRGIVYDIRRHDGDDGATVALCEAIDADLSAARDEVLAGPAERAAKLRRRARRAVAPVHDVLHGRDFPVVVLAVRLLIETLIHEGHIVLHAGSTFDHAWTRLAEALETADTNGALDRPERRGEASVLARMCRRELARQGYYRRQEVAA